MALRLSQAPPTNTNKWRFVAELSRRTGLNKFVVGAWVATEEPGFNATTRGDQNWLNVGQTDRGPNSAAFGGHWLHPVDAADATADFLKGKWGGASQGIRDILKSAGKSPSDQISAIGNSGWATDPDYGKKIADLYNVTTGDRAAFKTAQHGGTDAQSGGLIPGSQLAQDALNSLAKSFGNFGDILKFLFSLKFLYVIGGAVLLLIALVIIARQSSAIRKATSVL